MDISAISGPSSGNTLSDGSKVSNGADSFGMDDFFKLLAAQLQYQDPSSATSNDQFMQEMAQFSTVTAIENLVKVTNYSMASGMVGKTVTYQSATMDLNGYVTTTSQNGKVEAVDFTSDTPRCYIATTDKDGKVTGNWVDYSDISQVYSDDVTVDPTAGGSTGDSATGDPTTTA
jgi:flagellar basal-body rod modification protein FlgD